MSFRYRTKKDLDYLKELFNDDRIVFDGTFDEFVSEYERNTVWSDGVHPLAVHVRDDADESTKEHAEFEQCLINMRVEKLMKDKGISTRDLAKVLPKADGTIGVSISYASRLVGNPAIATAPQVDAMCELFGCTYEYMLCRVDDDIERSVDYGSPDDLAEVYRKLDAKDKRSVWNHAVALLAFHEGETVYRDGIYLM